MSQRILRKVDLETLVRVANFQNKEPVSKNKTAVRNAISVDVEEAAVKYLCQTMSKSQLEAAVNYLNIDHGNNNPNNKMVLSKRLKESMLADGIKQWFANCDNHQVVQQIGKALSIRGFSTMGIRLLKKTIEEELDIIGCQIVFGSLNIQLLRDCAEAMDIPNFEYASTKTPLIQAITLGIEIPEPQKTRKRARKPKFSAIEDCESYEQLFQHYLLDSLVSWCKDNGLKTSGNKRTVINRILAYNAGDKENTMADPTRVNKSRSTKSKKVDSKPVPEPTRVSRRQQEKAQADEQMEDASESESESISEEQMQEEEPVADESESIAMDLSESEDPAHPSSLDGITVACSGKLPLKKETIFEIVERNGGVAFKGTKVTKGVNVLILPEDKLNDPKFQKLAKANIKIVSVDYLKNME